MKKSNWLILLIVLIAAGLFVAACDDDTTEPADQGPDIPPLSTFLMNFDNFPDTSSTAGLDVQSYDNWGWSALNVAVWNLVIAVHGVVPVAAYVESFNHVPQQQEDGSWVWTYNVTSGTDTYTAELHCSTDAEGLNWEMYLSKEGEFTDFLWFEGQNNLLYTHGTWTLYKEPDDPVEFIGIEWHRNLSDGTADIRYTNIESGAPGEGGYISYGTTTDVDYDAFYEIYIIEQQHNIDIEWNLATHPGRVMDETHFEDTLWHCWDENLEDIDCN